MSNKQKTCKFHGQVLAHKNDNKNGCGTIFGAMIISAILMCFIGVIPAGIFLVGAIIMCGYDNDKFLCPICGEVCK